MLLGWGGGVCPEVAVRRKAAFAQGAASLYNLLVAFSLRAPTLDAAYLQKHIFANISSSTSSPPEEKKQGHLHWHWHASLSHAKQRSCVSVEAAGVSLIPQ